MSNNNNAVEKKNQKIDLFQYTEEELLGEHVLTHYEVLGLPVHCSRDDVKRAYRKASLKYHPDKTGRGEDDFVFLAVKAAYDALFDHAKRQAYDSTVLPFDDAIPPARSSLLSDPLLSYTDEDFYGTFGPVFERNLRFDARLRPEAAGKNSRSSSSSGGGGGKNNNKNGKKKEPPPSLGDSETPLDRVHSFYEYWIHFESWRDFSQAATDELQVENELENAESRYEKRWLQKEIDKRAKVMKRKEMARVQQLVERAMEADPRLRAERQAAVDAKERKERERADAEERKKRDEILRQKELAEAEEQERQRKVEERAERERHKKLLRKARQSLRKLAGSSFDSSHESSSSDHYEDAYDMQKDVDLLCSLLALEDLKDFTTLLESSSNGTMLSTIKDRATQERQRQAMEEEERQRERQEQLEKRKESSNGGDGKSDAKSDGNGAAANRPPAWTKEELSALAKAVRKYPPGTGGSRWEQITTMVNNLCKLDWKRSREECIEKYNDVARSGNKPPPAAATATAAAASATSMPDAAPVTGGGGGDDGWTVEQDQQLQAALKQYPATMDKNERWTAIAKAVTGKTKKQCVQRFKAIREALQKKTKQNGQ